MSPIALAHIIQEDCGIETIFHLTCRDRNYIGLQAELLGAAGLGVHNILTLTGDNPQNGDTPQAKAVFDTDTCGLIRLAHTLNTGTDINENALGAATHFYIGAAANPGISDQSLEMAKLANKVSSGAEFIQTQPIYDLEVAKRFIDNASRFNIPILLGLMPLRGIKMATYLENNVPGISIPMDNSYIKNNLETIFENFQRMIKVETVVGEAVHIGDAILIPFVDVTLGFASGGYNGKCETGRNSAGSGGGAKLEPTAILVIKGDRVEMFSIKKGGYQASAFEKLITMIFERVTMKSLMN